MTDLHKHSGRLIQLLKCTILLLGLSGSVSWSGSLYPDKWDGDFKDATLIFLPPGTEWQLLKAQCYQESRLKPLARSPVGAYGLCQFMPGTAKDVGKKLNVTPDQFWLPEVSIRAAGYYMGGLNRSWKVQRPMTDRQKLSQASYNAGIGHLLSAQKLCGNRRLYGEIIVCLPSVTGHNSRETIDYVEKINNKWYPRMLLD